MSATVAVLKIPDSDIDEIKAVGARGLQEFSYRLSVLMWTRLR